MYIVDGCDKIRTKIEHGQFSKRLESETWSYRTNLFDLNQALLNLQFSEHLSGRNVRLLADKLRKVKLMRSPKTDCFVQN